MTKALFAQKSIAQAYINKICQNAISFLLFKEDEKVLTYFFALYNELFIVYNEHDNQKKSCVSAHHTNTQDFILNNKLSSTIQRVEHRQLRHP